jgi:hypothetical protein
MTRSKNRNSVRAVSSGNRTDSLRHIQLFCQFSIRYSRAVRNIQQLIPYTFLKIRTYKQERYIECLPLSGKILVQLLPGAFDYSRSTFLKFGIPHPFQSVVHPGTMLFRPPVAKTEFIAYRTKQQHAAGRLIGIDYDFILIFHTAEIG